MGQMLTPRQELEKAWWWSVNPYMGVLCLLSFTLLQLSQPFLNMVKITLNVRQIFTKFRLRFMKQLLIT